MKKDEKVPETYLVSLPCPFFLKKKSDEKVRRDIKKVVQVFTI